MSAPINRTMAPTEWALLVALSLLWGGSFFFVAIAVTALPPFSIVAIRVAIGALLLYLAVRATGRHLPSDRARSRTMRGNPPTASPKGRIRDTRASPYNR